MLSLKDFRLDNILFSEQIKRYEEIARHDDYTVMDFIYNYLSDPKMIKRRDTDFDKSVNAKSKYMLDIEKKVKTGKPIELIFTSLDPKPVKLSITNGQIYPDIGELLSFVHLALVAKAIRNIYSPGLRFILVYEGNLFQKECRLPSKGTEKTYVILRELAKEAERIVGVRNVIKVIDLYEVVDHSSDEFHETFYDMKKQVEKRYKRDKIYQEPLDLYADYIYDHVAETSDFDSELEAKKFCLNVAFTSRAFKKMKYYFGSSGLGIREKFPNSIKASTKRKTRNILSMNLFPWFEHYPYNRLTSLSKEGKWMQWTWEEMQASSSTFEPVFVEEYDQPFYFREK